MSLSGSFSLACLAWCDAVSRIDRVNSEVDSNLKELKDNTLSLFEMLTWCPHLLRPKQLFSLGAPDAPCLIERESSFLTTHWSEPT